MELSENGFKWGMFGLLVITCLVFIVVIIKESIKEHQNPPVKHKYIIVVDEAGHLETNGFKSYQEYDRVISDLQFERNMKFHENVEKELEKEIKKLEDKINKE